jgi:predicted DsbA family dithiol-disulfide isomerase
MGDLTIEIWADLVCPWCYIAEARFRSALSGFAHRDDVRIVRRSFQLDPDAPRMSGQTPIQMLSAKYGVGVAQAAAMEKRVADLAAAEGLTITPDRFISNTRDAHRLLHLAADRGVDGVLARGLYSGHFTGQEVIDDPEALVRLAAAVGLDAGEVKEVLAADAYREQVDADQREARELGANGVPFYVLDRRFAVSGAQPTGAFLDTLDRAWKSRESAAPGQPTV